MKSNQMSSLIKIYFTISLRKILLASTMLLLITTFTPISSDNVYAYNASGNEDRCEALGANCVCSEPMNTNNLVLKGNNYSLDPKDTTAKECTGADGVAGGVIVGNDKDSDPTSFIVAENSSSVLGALPSGNKVNFVIRGANNNAGTGGAPFYIGHKADSKFIKRMAYRYYVYHTSDFEFTQMCSGNTKFAEGPAIAGMHYNSSGIKIQYYGTWNKWTYANGTKQVGDCCQIGPPGKDARQPLSFYQGKWIRVEGVVTNRLGGASPNGFTFKLYMKNITDGTPEMKVVDTTISAPGAGFSTDWLGKDDVTPSSLVKNFFSNNYREGACKGYRAITHYMVAGWDTDEGQRIGSANEVEGVMGEYGTGISPPVNPGEGWNPNPSSKVLK